MQPQRAGGRGPAIVAGVVVSLIWASSFFLIKEGIRTTDPLAFAGWRYTAGGAILAAALALRGRLPRPGAAAWRYAAGCGLLAYTAGQGLLYAGQARVAPLAGAFFYSLAPAFVLVLALAWRPRLPSAANLAGLVAVVGGGLLFAPPESLAGTTREGVALLLLSNVATAGYLLLARRALDDGVPAAWLAATSLLIGGAALFATCALLGGDLRLAAPGLAPMLWLAVVNTALAYALYVRALAVLPPFQLSMLTALIPGENALMGLAAFGRPLAPHEIAALLVTLAGVVLVQAQRPRTARCEAVSNAVAGSAEP